MNTFSIIINAVDCYSGNSNQIWQYSFSRGVQHQIMFIHDDYGVTTELFAGYRNRAADSDRGEAIILRKRVTEEAWNLANECKSLAEKITKYPSQEEFEKVAAENARIEKKLKPLVKRLYNLEGLGIEFSQFYNHFIY